MVYNNSYSENVHSYVNNINTHGVYILQDLEKGPNKDFEKYTLMNQDYLKKLSLR